MWINSHASDNAVRQSFLGGVCAKGKVQGDTVRGSKISFYYPRVPTSKSSCFLN